MNYLKKFIVLLVTSSIILSNTIPVNASTDINAVNDFFTYWVELLDESVNGDRYEEWLKKVSKHAFDTAGFLIDESGIIIQKIKDAIHGSDNNMPSDMTDEEAYEWIKDNVSVSGSNIVYGDQFNNFVKNYETTYVNDNKYYLGYSLDLQYYDLPADINTFVQEHDDQLVFIKRAQSNYLVFTDNTLNTNNYGFVYNGKETEVYNTLPYNLNTFGSYTRGDPGYQNAYADGVTVYLYKNGVFSQLTHRTGDGNTAYQYFYFMERNYTYRVTDWDFPNWINYWNCVCVSYGHVKEIPIYGTKPLLESSERGTMPYYYNNTVWQDFSSSTGDYTFSPTNINTVTYGDTISYINDYHDTNNNYPDNSTVNNWINNTNEENITNNGGGSGGDDSGGGSGSGTDGIFDFLSDLGEVLGNLIKNLGQAITNIIKGISDLVTSIVTDLPTVFFDFIGAIFGWLPEEWVTLLSLSLAAMLIWGIVKVIRG